MRVVDDAQWLDRASALTLAFVARRLLADPVGIVFAAREPGDELQHVPELEVRGLSNGDARALLGTAVPELFVSGWALPELIEAAARTGKRRLAGEALERLGEATSAGSTDWGLGVLARSRALLSDGAAAEAAYRAGHRRARAPAHRRDA